MNGLIFQKFPKFEPKLAQVYKKLLEKSGDFDQNLAKNWTDWYMNGSLFLEKLVFVWVYFQIPWRHLPTKTKLDYPTPPGPLPIFKGDFGRKGYPFLRIFLEK